LTKATFTLDRPVAVLVCRRCDQSPFWPYPVLLGYGSSSS